MKNNLTPTLTLAQLELFDPQASAANVERRFWCPLCGETKPRDAAHRSLCVNTQNGLWNCKRCSAKGLLGEFQRNNTDASSSTRATRAANALKRSFSLEVGSQPVLTEKMPHAALEADVLSTQEAWRAIHQAAQPVTGTAGEEYLQHRAIPVKVAEQAGVLFSRNWHSRSALVFPFCNQEGSLVAIAGRCLRNGGIDKPAAGPKKQGAFFAPAGKFLPLDEAVPAIILCEAPFDALSLASAGFPTLALGGTAPPTWLVQACAFRRVALALDADDAGDAASERIGELLSSVGTSCQRLRPDGAKDWNEYLQLYSTPQLSDFLALHLL